ncbi:DedA family protein [Streptomyces sp. BK79]|uniref:DedA family protein n=1 Tax=Streptomyces sp. BK79 TaxID=3350097 RepID=UPI00376FA979
MARRGGQAVFLTRFVPVVRTLAPHLAGATRTPYRRIAPYSLLAAPLWAGAEAGVGYAAATSVQHTIAVGGPALAITVSVTAAAILTVARIRRRRQTGSADPEGAETAARTPPRHRTVSLSCWPGCGRGGGAGGPSGAAARWG